MKNLTMAISRSAYRRYKVIDAMLRNKSRTYPSLTDIQDACLDKLDMSPSRDTLEKSVLQDDMTNRMDNAFTNLIKLYGGSFAPEKF